MRTFRFSLSLAVLLALISAALAIPAAAEPTAGSTAGQIVGVGDEVHGKGYAEWSASWWRWVISSNRDQSAFQDGRVRCVQGQHQPDPGVVFLAGPFNETGEITRTCQDPISARAFILIPVVNVECSDLEPQPFYGATPGEREVCATRFDISGLVATVDGWPVPDLEKYIVTSEDFRIFSARNNPAGIPVGFGHSTSNGAWLMLKPPRSGPHTVQFSGTLSGPGIEFTATAQYKFVVGR